MTEKNIVPLVTHYDVILSIRKAIVFGSSEVNSSKDMLALADLLRAYNQSQDWFAQGNSE